MNIKLDDLLKQWRAVHTPDESQRMALRNRVLRDLQFPAQPAADAEDTRSAGWGWIPRLAVGVAAVAMVAVSAWQWMIPAMGPEGAEVASPADLSGITPSKALLAFYAGSKELFGDALVWVAQSGQAVEMEVGNSRSESSRTAEADPVYAVTIAIVTRKDGESKIVWKSDVIARDESWINLPATVTRSIKLSTWFYRIGEGKLTMDSQWTVCNHPAISGAASQIATEGQPTAMGTFQCDGVDYEIYQVARPLGSITG